MKPATVFWMGVATLALVVAAWAAHSNRSRVSRIEKGPMFPGLLERANEVAEIEIESGDGAFRVVREEGRWIIPAKGGYQARPDRARELVQSLAELQIIEPKTSNPNLFPELGLVEPSDPDGSAIKITLRDESGETLASLHRGGYLENAVFTRWFARRNGESQAWYIEGTMPRASDPLRWINRALVQTHRSQMVEVEIEREDGRRLVAVRTAPYTGQLEADTDAWELRGGAPPDGGQEENLAYAIATAVSYIGLEDVAPADELPWPDKEASVMRYRTDSGLQVEARLAEIAGEWWVQIAAATTDAVPISDQAAPPAEKETATSAETRAREINRRVSGFAFKVNDTDAQGLLGEATLPGAQRPPPQGGDVTPPGAPETSR